LEVAEGLLRCESQWCHVHDPDPDRFRRLRDLLRQVIGGSAGGRFLRSGVARAATGPFPVSAAPPGRPLYEPVTDSIYCCRNLRSVIGL